MVEIWYYAERHETYDSGIRVSGGVIDHDRSYSFFTHTLSRQTTVTACGVLYNHIEEVANIQIPKLPVFISILADKSKAVNRSMPD